MMREEGLDARSSQGFINAPQDVEQHFGDQQDIDTQGGDAAGRDIHTAVFRWVSHSASILLAGVSETLTLSWCGLLNR